MTLDMGFYSAWIAYVAINFQKVLNIFPLQIKPLETVCSWETKKKKKRKHGKLFLNLEYIFKHPLSYNAQKHTWKK